jgi:hypothetical protein
MAKAYDATCFCRPITRNHQRAASSARPRRTAASPPRPTSVGPLRLRSAPRQTGKVLGGGDQWNGNPVLGPPFAVCGWPRHCTSAENPPASVFEYPAFAVQSLAVYRTSISLIIWQITSKYLDSPGTSFMFHYALRGCFHCIYTRSGWNSLESVRKSEKT